MQTFAPWFWSDANMVQQKFSRLSYCTKYHHAPDYLAKTITNHQHFLGAITNHHHTIFTQKHCKVEAIPWNFLTLLLEPQF